MVLLFRKLRINLNIRPLTPISERLFMVVSLLIVSNAFSKSKNTAVVVFRFLKPLRMSVVKVAIGSVVVLSSRNPYCCGDSF